MQEYTRLAEEPPNPAAPPDWAERISAHCVRIDLEENGLLGTFFQALREGDVERLLLRPPKGREPERSALPAGIVPADPEGAEKGATTFLGLPMMQNRNVGFALQELTRHLAADGARAARIIQIGIDLGGLAALLQIYCLAQNIEFIAYDSAGSAAQTPVFKRLQIDVRVRDLRHEFVIAESPARSRSRDGRCCTAMGRSSAGSCTSSTSARCSGSPAATRSRSGRTSSAACSAGDGTTW